MTSSLKSLFHPNAAFGWACLSEGGGSHLLMPGFRGTPAGITTTSQPSSAAAISSGPLCPVTWSGSHGWGDSADVISSPAPSTYMKGREDTSCLQRGSRFTTVQG